MRHELAFRRAEHSRHIRMSLFIFLIYNIYYLYCLCIDLYDHSAWYGCCLLSISGGWFTNLFKCVSFCLHGCCGKREGWARNPVNHTSWVTVATPTDRPKSVRNRCLIELFCGVVCVVALPFWHFSWFWGFCHRIALDLFFFSLVLAHFIGMKVFYKVFSYIQDCYINYPH